MGHDHDHGHEEAPDRQMSRKRLGLALFLTSTILVAEVVGGLVSGSLALLADAAHMMTDVGALLMSYTAMRLAERPATRHHTFGLHRVEILAAFVNAQVLLLLSAFLLWEAWHRWVEPTEIRTGIMLGVALVGLAGNLASMGLLHGHHHGSLNVRAAYLEVLTDALASVGVIIGALVIQATGWYGVDALATFAIALVIVPRTVQVLRESAHILLEGSPLHLDLGELKDEVHRIPGVVELHDLHVWTLTSGVHSASVHIRAAEDSPRGEVLRAVRRCLHDFAGVSHATVQIEWGPAAHCETTEHEY